MGLFSELGKAAQSSLAAPWTATQDVLVRGRSPAEALQTQLDKKIGHGKSIIGEVAGMAGMDNPFGGGGGGGGGGGTPGINYYEPRPGDFYVDPTIMMQTGGGGIVGGPNVNDPSYLYEQAAGKWFDYGIDPKGMLADKYTYDPTLIDTGQMQMMEAFNYDPVRQEAMGDLSAQSSSALQSALSQQAAAGGLTAADRMALASSFNRQRMGGTADLLGQFGVAEAQNIWETEAANKDLMNKAYLQNLETQNQADLMNMQTLMAQQEKADQRAMDMYEKDLQRKMARELGGETIGKAPTPAAAPIAPTPAPAPAPAPKPRRSRGGGGGRKLDRMAAAVV